MLFKKQLSVIGFIHKLLIILILVFICANSAKAQNVYEYQFSATNSNYTSLGSSASVVSLTTNPLMKQVPIGFTFNFAGTNYTNAYACVHGFLSFNPNAVFSSQNNLTSGGLGTGTQSSRPLLAPLW